MSSIAPDELSTVRREAAAVAASAAGGRGWYVSGLLFLIGAFNLMDRQILAILLEPIKRDLAVSDTAMGVLTGFAFVAFYTVTSLPIARLADAYSRRNIIALALAFWSVMTSLAALASSFLQLALLRVGVGAAESATGPAGQALVADLFAVSRRTIPMSMLAIASPVGVMLAFIIGGALNQQLGWRMTLVCMGAPGVLLALLWLLTVQEPTRGASDDSHAPEVRFRLSTTLRYLLGLRSFCAMTLGASLMMFTVVGLVVWSPAYLERVHGISSSQVGLSLGLATGLGGIAGGLCAGMVAQRLVRRDLSWLMRLPALTSLLATPLVAAFLLLGNSPAAVPMFFGVIFCGVAMLAPVMSATQSLAKVHMRAVAAAVVTLTFNFIGSGFGPFAVGFASDLLAPGLGAESLRAGLWLTAITSVGAALAFALGSRYLRTDVGPAMRTT